MPGKNFWRVRSLLGSDQSKWVTGSFTVAPVTTPIPLAPADGAALAQPQSPPLLQWSSSQGAISYSVEVDADADLIGAKVYSTKTTSLVVPDPLTLGDWYWRVTAVKGTGLVSLPSDSRGSTSCRSPSPRSPTRRTTSTADRGRRRGLDAGAGCRAPTTSRSLWTPTSTTSRTPSPT